MFDFRPLERADLPLLVGWLKAGHVARWWDLPPDPETKYCGGTRPVRYFIAMLEDRPVGMVQIYNWLDFPADADAVEARSGEVGIDYLLGEIEMIGRGLGPTMLAAFLQRFVTGRGEISGVRVDVAEANRRSWRTLEKLDFKRVRANVTIEGQSGPHYIYSRENDLP